jgi:hypothetical protein
MKNLKDLNLSSYFITESGELFSKKTNVFLKGAVAHHGYRFYTLIDDHGTVVRRYAHRIVAELFLEKPCGNDYVNHIDGVKLNNSKNNLEWVTASENNNHAYSLGLSKGKSSGNGIYLKGDYNESSETEIWSEDSVRITCEMIKDGYRDVDISRITDLPRRIINKIRHREFSQYAEIIDLYEFKFTKEERMSPDKVIEICKLLERKTKIVDICDILGVNRKHVGNIKNRRTFVNISKSFRW